jgi:hypothetical protein
VKSKGTPTTTGSKIGELTPSYGMERTGIEPATSCDGRPYFWRDWPSCPCVIRGISRHNARRFRESADPKSNRKAIRP